MAFDGVPEELSYEVFSLRTGFNDGQHVFDEAVSSFTASLEVQCTPDHSVTKAAFATVVCGCHVRIFQESPIDAYAVRTHAVLNPHSRRDSTRWRTGRRFRLNVS